MGHDDAADLQVCFDDTADLQVGVGLSVGGLLLDEDLSRPIQGGLVLGVSLGLGNAADLMRWC